MSKKTDTCMQKSWVENTTNLSHLRKAVVVLSTFSTNIHPTHSKNLANSESY